MKDKKIVEHTEIIAARKSENSVCGMPLCVSLLKPAVYRALHFAGRLILASHGGDEAKVKVYSSKSVKNTQLQVHILHLKCFLL